MIGKSSEIYVFILIKQCQNPRYPLFTNDDVQHVLLMQRYSEGTNVKNGVTFIIIRKKNMTFITDSR